ncbi:MAG: hypothetical protein J1E60_03545 [Christensenellaceae bacterium]|nr:hypothetical protein [Christensenellaceae bacterium]
MNRTVKVFALMLCMILLLGFGAVPTSANSVPKFWSGSTGMGAIIADEDCPIVVENELLTFDIHEFPERDYEQTQDFLEYSAFVTAQYTFYNPADYTIIATLVFPFGKLPSYGNGYSFWDSKLGMYVNVNDTDKYDITINGNVIEKTLRHTLMPTGASFELEEDLGRLCDGYIDDPFFRSDMPVTKYTYSISGIDDEYDAANAAFDLAKFDGKTKLLFMELRGTHVQKNKSCRISAWVKNGSNLTLYAIGEPLNGDPQWKFYENGGVKDKEEIEGSATLVSTEEMTFEEFVLKAYVEESDILASDWYNAMVMDLNRNESKYGVVSRSDSGFDLSHSLMRWYEYEITLAPGERLVNAVTAPMYPSIDGYWDPNVYDYTYLLSPAQKWSEFGSLEIVINTPFFVTESSLGDFEKTDSGYRLVRDGLPSGELKFSLCSVENPKKDSNWSSILFLIIFIGSPIIIIVGVIFLIVFGIVCLIRGIKSKKRI